LEQGGIVLWWRWGETNPHSYLAHGITEYKA